ncbi:hypothetical protein QBC35DRAFT_363018, partial [Podospora australis]
WLSVRRRDDAPPRHQCGVYDDYYIGYEECHQAFRRATMQCPLKGARYCTQGGGLQIGECLVYEIQTQTMYDELNPPWAPIAGDLIPDCGDNGKPTNILAISWRGTFTKFCSNTTNFDDDNKEIQGGWTYEHEDPNGCLAYTIMAY